jgi:Putative transposase/Transposase zinc-binding domain
LSPEQHEVLSAIARCRTAELGGHIDRCEACGHGRPSYNSCRNRHCPKCQALRQARWIDGRAKRVLPIHYFHVVFTLPSELRPLAARYPALIYDLLFASASATLVELGEDEARLGAQLGVTMVLHTWKRDLQLHPHVHAIVTGGGLSFDGARWIPAPDNYLFPVKVMGALFRGKFLAALAEAHRCGQLSLDGQTAPVDPEAFARLQNKLYKKSWVVYSKRPFGGAEQVIRYLGNYTHRVGISNHRLLAVDSQSVTFRTRGNGTVTVTPDEFITRFLRHVLPKGFVKIRHYGLNAASNATTKLEAARQLLAGGGTAATMPSTEHEANLGAPADWRELFARLTGIDVSRCSACGAQALVREPLTQECNRAPPEAA